MLREIDHVDNLVTIVSFLCAGFVLFMLFMVGRDILTEVTRKEFKCVEFADKWETFTGVENGKAYAMKEKITYCMKFKSE